MNILTWNLEWAGNRSARGAEISRLIASHAPSVVCLTELTLGITNESSPPRRQGRQVGEQGFKFISSLRSSKLGGSNSPSSHPIKNQKSTIVIHQSFPPSALHPHRGTHRPGRQTPHRSLRHFARPAILSQTWMPKVSDAGTCPGKASGDAELRLSDHTGILAEIL